MTLVLDTLGDIMSTLGQLTKDHKRPTTILFSSKNKEWQVMSIYDDSTETCHAAVDQVGVFLDISQRVDDEEYELLLSELVTTISRANISARLIIMSSIVKEWKLQEIVNVSDELSILEFKISKVR